MVLGYEFWLQFYFWLGLGILWFLTLAFTYYLYTLVRGHEKVLSKLYVALVWVAFLIAVSIVIMLTFGGR